MTFLYVVSERISLKLKIIRQRAVCPSRLSFIPKFCEKLVANKLFDHFITLCILLNTVVLALEYEGASETLLHIVAKFNDVFTFVFLFEILAKMISTGPIECLKKPVNLFDFVVVVIGIYDFISQLYNPDSQDSGLTVIRSLRLLRVFRLAQKWETMKRLQNVKT